MIWSLADRLGSYYPKAQRWVPSPSKGAARGVVNALVDRFGWDEDTAVTATWDAVASIDSDTEPMHPFDVSSKLRLRERRGKEATRSADVTMTSLNEHEARWHLLMTFGMAAERDLPRPLAADRRLIQKAMDALVALDGRIPRPRLAGHRTSVPFLELVPSLRDAWRGLEAVLHSLPKSGRPRMNDGIGPLAALRRHGAMCFAAMSEAGVVRPTMLELVLSARNQWLGCPPLSDVVVRSMSNRRAAIREAIKRRIYDGRMLAAKCRAERFEEAEAERREREGKALLDKELDERRRSVTTEK